MQLVKMVRKDGAEAVVEEHQVEEWRGHGFAPEDESKPKAPAKAPKKGK